MKVLVTGAGGQLGQALQSVAPPGVSVRALTHAELDIADEAAVQRALRELRPDILMNAAAFTRVDDAESHPAIAERVNTDGPTVLACACRALRSWLVHISTDYVFDGAQSRPYGPAAGPNPLSTYGRTKLAGELAVRRELQGECTLVRTSWLYGVGHRNFLTTMLRRLADGAELRVVSDQIGAPTATAGLARVLWALGLRRAAGVHHWCDSGVASWYDFAVAIAEESLALGLIHTAPTIVPISSAEYPLLAARPAYSLLDKRDTERLLGLRAAHWRASLRDTLRSVARPEVRGAA